MCVILWNALDEDDPLVDDEGKKVTFVVELGDGDCDCNVLDDAEPVSVIGSVVELD